MSVPKQTLNQLLELVNLYPSPHNGQPIRLAFSGDQAMTLYFERNRGLQATDISFLFSFVSMGVFVEHLSLCAWALGHSFSYQLALPSQSQLHGQGTVVFANATINWDAHPPDAELIKTIQFRQTSRKKYYQGINDQLSSLISKISAENQMALTKLDQDQSKQTIWLNQRAVFDDMFDEPVRRELDHWLRYTSQQKQATKDGLAYDCMELNGRLMKFIVNHPKILRLPGVSAMLKQYYLRSMTDQSNVYYMLAPFGNETEAFQVGIVIMKIWKEIAQDRYYLHPFGTIMSNQAAHQDFLKLARIDSENRQASYLVFIFRCGKSAIPHSSLRLPVNEHLVLE